MKTGFASFIFLACALSAQPPVVVRGRVALSDGGPLPEKAQLELLCRDQAQPQGRTDDDGKFIVTLGQYRHEAASQASSGSAALGSGFGGELSGQQQSPGGTLMALMGCSFRAVLKGYISEMADLSRARLGEPVNVGTIVLRKIAAGENTVSASSLAAPRNARQALEKAREHISRQQFAEAEKELEKAVKAYPKYAEAWTELGFVFLGQNRRPEARKALLEAVASDAKYPRPYLSLALMAATERDWKDALEKSAEVIAIDSKSYPQAWYYNAVAQYNLGSEDKALESARRAVELDTAHTTPLAEQMLGVLYSMKGDYKSAVEQYRNYLQHVPPGTNVEAVKTRLAEAEAKLAK